MLWAVVFLGLYGVVLVWGHGFYLSDWRMGDIFVPASAAVAWREGLQIHTEFRSPFGLLYFLHQALSWRLAEAFKPGRVSPHDVMAIASILSGFSFAVLVALMVRLLSTKIPLWLFFALLVMAISNHGVVVASHRALWSGFYNNFLVAVCIVLLFMVVSVENRYKRPAFVLLGIAFSLCFLYKASFAFAVLVLAMALGVRLWREVSQFLWQIAIFAITAAVASALLIVLFEYDLLAYFEDLSVAGQAKREFSLSVKTQYIPVYFVMIGTLLFLAEKVTEGGAVRQACVWGLVLLAILLAAFGCIAVSIRLVYMFAAVVAFVPWRKSNNSPRARLVVGAFACLPLLHSTAGDAYEVVRQGYAKIFSRSVLIEAYEIYDREPFRVAEMPRVDEEVYYPFCSDCDPMASLLGSHHETADVVDYWQPRLSSSAVSMAAFQSSVWSLADASLSKFQLHWKHFGVNLPLKEGGHLIDREVQHADILLLPKSRPREAHFDVACYLLYRSEVIKDFQYADTAKAWLVLIRSASVEGPAPELRPVSVLMEDPHTKALCDRVGVPKKARGLAFQLWDKLWSRLR